MLVLKMASLVNGNRDLLEIHEIKCISYNMHGFNQGCSLLKNLCVDSDCICIQEHWLSPANLYKLENFSKNFFFFGKSAMESVIMNSVLRGRPFGGAGILLNNRLLHYVTDKVLADKFVAVVLDNMIIMSLYLPAVGSANYGTVLSDTIDEIDTFVNQYPNYNLIIGGDFNVDLRSKSGSGFNLINNFIEKNKCIVGNLFLPSNEPDSDYTYFQERLNYYSYIDYFVISSYIKNDVIAFKILEKPCNMSDHNAISINIKLNSPLKCKIDVKIKPDQVLRWDRSDLQSYYNVTYDLFYPILEKIERTVFTDNYLESCKIIECIYFDIISSLSSAAGYCIKKKKVNFYKYWWSQELDALKSEAIRTHKNWLSCNKPKFGPIFDSRVKAKLAYKTSIKTHQSIEASNVSNSLHDALCQKNCKTFWGMFKSKFGSKLNLPKSIEGLADGFLIANEFLHRFEKIGQKKTTPEMERCTENRLAGYTGDDILCEHFDLELVDRVITELKVGKAVGVDSLSAEHLQFSHPIVVYVIHKLFNFMIDVRFVPDAFGMGITTPIPKGSNYTCKFDEYRGITVSPVISKFFEICLLSRIKPYLSTSNRQFGFKSKIGCRDAIFTLRSTVEHFTNNNSTVNVCSIDLSKAFDRLDHCILFNKLMDRGVPNCYIKIIVLWYNKLYISVKWGGFRSMFSKIVSGVRQGGILSPGLFNLVVDSVLNSLEKSKLGCFIKAVCRNSIMYADDLILLSISISHLHRLTALCNILFGNLNMEINTSKSSIIRIGSRHCADFCPIMINNLAIGRNTELKYLGIVICSNVKFAIKVQPIRQKFFKSINGIFGKVGLRTSERVLCSLANSICVPILLYATESVNLNTRDLNSLNQAYIQIFAKNFGTFDPIILEQCQYFMGYLPFRLLIDTRKLNFLSLMLYKEAQGISTSISNIERDHFVKLCVEYKFPNDLTNYTAVMNDYFSKKFENN